VDLTDAALDRGDWADARDLLDRLALRGVRNAGLSTLAQTSAGELLRSRRPAYAEALAERIAQLNAGRDSDPPPASTL
jgi:hypothetical protein